MSKTACVKRYQVSDRKKSVVFEVCIDAPSALAVCRAGGADRVELCSALALGGLTPSHGLMKAAADCGLPCHAMIRPRDGGFSPDGETQRVMLSDIAAAREIGLAGVVVGALTADHKLDLPFLERCIAAAGALEVTLHRAFDLCADPVQAVEDAVALRMTRILTSGGAKHAWDGRHVIADMVAKADGRITIMAGSGVTAVNVAELVGATGVRDVHGSCAISVAEQDDVAAFGFGPPKRRETDLASIRAMRAALDRL